MNLEEYAEDYANSVPDAFVETTMRGFHDAIVLLSTLVRTDSPSAEADLHIIEELKIVEDILTKRLNTRS